MRYHDRVFLEWYLSFEGATLLYVHILKRIGSPLLFPKVTEKNSRIFMGVSLVHGAEGM